MVCIRALQDIRAGRKLTVTNPEKALTTALGGVARHLSAASRQRAVDDQRSIERHGLAAPRHRTVTVANKLGSVRPGVVWEPRRSVLLTDLSGDLPSDQSSRARSYTSAYGASDTHVYNQQKEVS